MTSRATVRLKVAGPITIGHVGSNKRNLVRPEDALEFLMKALVARESELRQTYLDGALSTYYFGLLNQHKFKASKHRRGGAKGSGRKPIDDTAALALMAKIAADTGEDNARELARVVLDMNKVPIHAERESIIRRLAARYKASLT